MFAPCTLKPGSTSFKNTDVAHHNAVVLDVDNEGRHKTITPALLAERYDAYYGFIYPTYSYTDEAPRYRIVLELAHPIPPEQLKPVVQELIEIVNCDYPGAISKKDSATRARKWYRPIAPQDKVDSFPAGEWLTGAPISDEFINQAIAKHGLTDSAPLSASQDVSGTLSAELSEAQQTFIETMLAESSAFADHWEKGVTRDHSSECYGMLKAMLHKLVPEGKAEYPFVMGIIKHWRVQVAQAQGKPDSWYQREFKKARDEVTQAQPDNVTPIDKAKRKRAGGGGVSQSDKTGSGDSTKWLSQIRWIENSPYASRLRFNVFADIPEMQDGKEWRALRDEDVRTIRRAMHEAGNAIGKEAIQEAVLTVADKRKVNPLRDYLNGLTWDGTERLDDMLIDYFGAEPDGYTRAVSACMMIAAVARALKPGCKADHVVVLEGAQDIGKSTALSILGGEYFGDDMPPVTDKDAKQYLAGRWIIEIAELSAIKRADVEHTKRFITTREDQYRAPYGRFIKHQPRTCIFVATTNSSEYLTDITGNRRYWPILCGEIKTERLRADRDQIIAEAVARYKSGDAWWLSGDILLAAQDAQENSLHQDPWQPEIERFTEGKAQVFVKQILDHLNIPIDKQDGAHKRVKSVLTLLGYRRKRLPANEDGKRPWAYLKTAKLPTKAK